MAALLVYYVCVRRSKIIGELYLVHASNIALRGLKGNYAKCRITARPAARKEGEIKREKEKVVDRLTYSRGRTRTNFPSEA